MKNRTSLFVLAVEILTIILLHTMKASENTHISAKEVPPAKAEMAAKDDMRPTIFLSTLK